MSSIWDGVRSFVDIAKHEIRTTANCEEYFFFQGVSCFMRTCNNMETDCVIDEEGKQFRLTVENHRPHRLEITANTTPANNHLKFIRIDRASWSSGIARWKTDVTVETAFVPDGPFASHEENVHTEECIVRSNETDENSEKIITSLEAEAINPDSLALEDYFDDEKSILVDLI